MELLQKQQLKDFAPFYDKNDKIRLLKVRKAVSEYRISHEELCSIYSDWLNQSEFMVIRHKKSGENVAVKCSKRGNDVYQFRIEQRFKELDILAEMLGNDRIFDINRENPKTNVLFVTLTYDTKLCEESEAWQNIGSEFNRYVSNIKRKFGNCSILRAWEGHKNGYPHIHAIFVFHENDFDVFEQQKTDNTTAYRIQQKPQFEKPWHSFVDVKAVSSIGGAIRYMTKYLRKTYGYDAETNLTQAQMWVHRKKSFSISHDFVKKLYLIRNLRCSNKKIKQITLDGDEISDWELVGFFSPWEIGVDGKSWCFENVDVDKALENREIRKQERRDLYPLYIANAGVGC